MAFSKDTVWLVTGCSKGGFGAEFCKKIQAIGHQLVATARDLSTLSYLSDQDARTLKLTLDVTSTAQIKDVFAAAVEKFGHVDVVINNAGYSIVGDTEAILENDARRQFDVNFWGSVDVTKEAIRVFREVNGKGGGGLVVQVSSLAGWVGFAGNAFYNGSKFAIEGFTESISQEMPPNWNIHFLILEPAGMKTRFHGSSMQKVPPHPAYQDPSFPTRKIEQMLAGAEKPQGQAMMAGPDRTAGVVVDAILNREARPLPLRLPLGINAGLIIKGKVVKTGQLLDEWKDVTESTMSDAQNQAVSKFMGGMK